jgi:hypothetical protein
MIKNNSLPIVYKPELKVKFGLLPLTAKSGDEVRRGRWSIAIAGGQLPSDCLCFHR